MFFIAVKIGRKNINCFILFLSRNGQVEYFSGTIEQYTCGF